VVDIGAFVLARGADVADEWRHRNDADANTAMVGVSRDLEGAIIDPRGGSIEWTGASIIA
jgi:hypothetical protein